MSELLAMDYGIIEQLSRHKNLRFGVFHGHRKDMNVHPT